MQNCEHRPCSRVHQEQNDKTVLFESSPFHQQRVSRRHKSDRETPISGEVSDTAETLEVGLSIASPAENEHAEKTESKTTSVPMRA